MDAIRIKKDFHRLIDSFNDIKILQDFYDIINNYNQKNTNIDILDELSSDQKERLKNSIKQSENGETISHHEMKSHIKKWLTK